MKRGKEMTCEEVLGGLRPMPIRVREEWCGSGIDARLAVGVRVVDLRRLALKIGRNHALALELYRRPVHEEADPGVDDRRSGAVPSGGDGCLGRRISVVGPVRPVLY